MTSADPAADWTLLRSAFSLPASNGYPPSAGLPNSGSYRQLTVWLDTSALLSEAAGSIGSAFADAPAVRNVSFAVESVNLRDSHALLRSLVAIDMKNALELGWEDVWRYYRSEELNDVEIQTDEESASGVVLPAGQRRIADHLHLANADQSESLTLVRKLRTSYSWNLARRLGPLLYVVALALVSLLGGLAAVILLLGETIGYSFLSGLLSNLVSVLVAAAGTAAGAGLLARRRRSVSVPVGQRRYGDPVIQRIFLGEQRVARSSALQPSAKAT